MDNQALASIFVKFAHDGVKSFLHQKLGNLRTQGLAFDWGMLSTWLSELSLAPTQEPRYNTRSQTREAKQTTREPGAQSATAYCIWVPE